MSNNGVFVDENSKKIGGVDVIVEDLDGEELYSFVGEDSKSFVQMAEGHDIELPVSCCSGACFVCACRVKEGLDDVDIAKLSVPLVDVDEDQVLTCVGGIKSSCFRDGKYHKIVLQKLL